MYQVWRRYSVHCRTAKRLEDVVSLVCKKCWLMRGEPTGTKGNPTLINAEYMEDFSHTLLRLLVDWGGIRLPRKRALPILHFCEINNANVHGWDSLHVSLLPLPIAKTLQPSTDHQTSKNKQQSSPPAIPHSVPLQNAGKETSKVSQQWKGPPSSHTRSYKTHIVCRKLSPNDNQNAILQMWKDALKIQNSPQRSELDRVYIDLRDILSQPDIQFYVAVVPQPLTATNRWESSA